MSRPEGVTTRVLRKTMSLNLEAVNAQLTEAGEPLMDAIALAKRRAWIRSKDTKKSSSSEKTASSNRGAPKKTSGQKSVRKRPAPLVPREDTFAAHVWRLPYTMDVNEVVKRARAKGITKGSHSQVYTIRAKYPKNPRPTPKLNKIASPTELREEDARVQERTAKEASNGSNEAALNVVTPKSNTAEQRQFLLLAVRIGLSTAETLLQKANKSLETAILGAIE